MSTAYLKLPSIVGKHGDDCTYLMIVGCVIDFLANFDIENSLWNHRCDYSLTKWLIAS
jgi:hypothetical protein